LIELSGIYVVVFYTDEGVSLMLGGLLKESIAICNDDTKYSLSWFLFLSSSDKNNFINEKWKRLGSP